MSDPCRYCNHVNASPARYCGHCGRLLGAATPSSEPDRLEMKCRSNQRPAGSLFLLALMGIAAMGVFWFSKARPLQSLGWTSATVARTYELPPAKAEALFDLLKPDDVPIIVDRQTHGISIRGTAEQARNVEAFIKLINSPMGHSPSRYRKKPNSGCEKIERTYKLSRSKAKSLYRTLCFQGAPVRVHRAGSKIEVSAESDDMGTIDRMVRILGGRRYESGAISF